MVIFMNSMAIEAQKNILFKVASSLLKNTLSEVKDDYKFKVPSYHLREIEKHNEILRLHAIDLRRVIDGI